MKKQEELEEFERFEAAYGKGCVGGGAKGSSRSGGLELAAELDGGCQLSNPGEIDFVGGILRGTPEVAEPSN